MTGVKCEMKMCETQVTCEHGTDCSPIVGPLTVRTNFPDNYTYATARTQTIIKPKNYIRSATLGNSISEVSLIIRLRTKKTNISVHSNCIASSFSAHLPPVRPIPTSLSDCSTRRLGCVVSTGVCYRLAPPNARSHPHLTVQLYIVR